jgi:hypothetical protein
LDLGALHGFAIAAQSSCFFCVNVNGLLDWQQHVPSARVAAVRDLVQLGLPDGPGEAAATIIKLAELVLAQPPTLARQT